MGIPSSRLPGQVKAITERYNLFVEPREPFNFNDLTLWFANVHSRFNEATVYFLENLPLWGGLFKYEVTTETNLLSTPDISHENWIRQESSIIDKVARDYYLMCLLTTQVSRKSFMPPSVTGRLPKI